MSSRGDITALVGDDLGDLEFVARGGSAAVYRATQRSLGRRVAVKVFDSIDLRGDRALTEARAQAAMSWHANVVTLLGTTTVADGSPALVMEFAPGGSLAERVDASGQLAASDWLRVGRELAGAVRAAHDSGIVHRDIKPSNVLFAADGSSRLADFGTAGSVTRTLDGIEGSVAFAPPEVLEGARPAPANDVYSLAVTLLVAATGRQPFDADQLPPAAVIAKVQSERLRFPSGLLGVPAPVIELLNRSLDPDPDRRPSAAELVAAFDGGGTPAAAPVRSGGGDRRRWGLVGGVLLVVALMGTVLAVGRWSSPETVVAPDLCAAFGTFTQQRQQLFEQVSTDLEQARTPVDVVDRLLVRYPQEWSRAAAPFLATYAASTGGSLTATESQLSQFTTADALRGLSGGKPFVFDGQSGSFDAASVPAELREPAEAFSAATTAAATTCPNEVVDLAPAKARMYSAIYANLANPAFMDDFFTDPRSFDLLGEQQILLMATLARPFFEGLLGNRLGWLLQLLERSPTVRSAMSVEHPDIVFQAATADPAAFAAALDDEWRADLRAGLERMGPAERQGVEAAFPEQVALVRSEGR